MHFPGNRITPPNEKLRVPEAYLAHTAAVCKQVVGGRCEKETIGQLTLQLSPVEVR